MKKVILINQTSGYLMVDIVNAYTQRYDEVIFMCGSLEVLDIPLSNKVRISKIISYNRKSKFTRIFTWCIATLQILLRLLFVYRKHEIIYVTNPPMSYLASLVIKRSFSIIVFDTYPDVLKNIGIKESNLVFKLWVKFNKKLFLNSKMIFTLSEGMKSCLMKYAPENKIKVIPVWSHPSQFVPVPKAQNIFLKENNLHEKFIILYSGNIGYTNSLEVIIECANILSEDKDIVFLFVGEGGTKKLLQKMVNDYGLKNCKFLSWLPSDILPYSLASADLAVITLNEETALLSVPSKTYHLMAVGAPLLCIAPKESELNNLVQKHKNGICIEKDSLSEIVNFIKMTKSFPLQKQVLGNNSRLASNYYTESNALKFVD